jgi:AcrR family transcriptional regulator
MPTSSTTNAVSTPRGKGLDGGGGQVSEAVLEHMLANAGTIRGSGREVTTLGSVEMSAKGNRLNRRGLETRQRIIEVAISALAAPDWDVVSANSIAKKAGMTWGTVQHQFGDVDNLWAAVLTQIMSEQVDAGIFTRLPARLDKRVKAIVEGFWRGFALPQARAVDRLRSMLPSDRTELGETYPATAAALHAWDQAWNAAFDEALGELAVNRTKLMRVRSFLPSALRGLRREAGMSSFTDAEAARRGIVDAIVSYLAD